MAAQHNVKCLYCGQIFDAKEEDKDIVWYKPRTNRYAHISCGKQADSTKSQEEKDFDELYRYVKDEQKENFNFVQFDRITKAWIKDYGYTYSGMLKSLLYFYEVKKNSKEKFRAGSLGIIPFCYVQAYNYYYNIYMANQVAGTGDYDHHRTRVVEIDPPAAAPKTIKLFNIEMEDDDEE